MPNTLLVLPQWILSACRKQKLYNDLHWKQQAFSILAYVSIQHPGFVAAGTETPRSDTEISPNYFAYSCVTIPACWAGSHGFLGTVWHLHPHLPLGDPQHRRSTGGFSVSQPEIRLLQIHTHSLGFHPHSKGISLPLILHRGQTQKEQRAKVREIWDGVGHLKHKAYV